MHEVGVFASFIAEHGEQTARRFVEHHPVQRWRTLRGECVRLEAAKQNVPQDLIKNLAKLDEGIIKLRDEFGQVFLTDYG